MGTYVHVGIVQDIFIHKKEIQGNVEVGLIEEKLCDLVNIKKYRYIPADDIYHWTIEDETLNNGKVKEFLKRQLIMFGNNSEDVMKVLETIKDAKQIRGLAAEKSLINFQLIKGNFLKYVSITGFNRSAVWYDMISFLSEGKVLAECYDQMGRYYRKLINLQKDEYPISDCVVVDINL